MSIAIRDARPDDAALIFDFIRELSVYEKLEHEVDADEALIRDALFGAAPRAYCDIAEWDGEPAGFALWFYNFSTFRGKSGIYLEDLFVRDAFRGRGLGKALLRRLAQRCIENDLPRLQWWVLDWNQPSIAFYKTLGAEAMTEWTVFRVSGDALEKLAR